MHSSDMAHSDGGPRFSLGRFVRNTWSSLLLIACFANGVWVIIGLVADNERLREENADLIRLATDCDERGAGPAQEDDDE